MPGGVIQRVLTEPTFRTEYLSLDGAKPEWSDRRIDAVFFVSHREADDRAIALRLATGELSIFAAVAMKPMPVSRHRPGTETAGFEPVRNLPAKKKQRRSDREREAMERHDIEELDEKAIYG